MMNMPLYALRPRRKAPAPPRATPLLSFPPFRAQCPAEIMLHKKVFSKRAARGFCAARAYQPMRNFFTIIPKEALLSISAALFPLLRELRAVLHSR